MGENAILDEKIGREVIERIASGGLIRLDEKQMEILRKNGYDGALFVWASNAPAEIGQVAGELIGPYS